MAGLQLPACAVTCSKYLGKADALCSYDKIFSSAVTHCVQRHCPTLEDVLQWQTQYASVCALPARDQGSLEVSITYALFAVATLSFVGRLLSRSRLMNGPGFWWDDLLVLVLWFMSIELVVCLAFMRHNGAGRDAIGWVSRDHVEKVLLVSAPPVSREARYSLTTRCSGCTPASHSTSAAPMASSLFGYCCICECK